MQSSRVVELVVFLAVVASNSSSSSVIIGKPRGMHLREYARPRQVSIGEAMRAIHPYTHPDSTTMQDSKDLLPAYYCLTKAT
jgi:hypothetical protein